MSKAAKLTSWRPSRERKIYSDNPLVVRAAQSAAVDGEEVEDDKPGPGPPAIQLVANSISA